MNGEMFQILLRDEDDFIKDSNRRSFNGRIKLQNNKIEHAQIYFL